jgi:hypothetical protein
MKMPRKVRRRWQFIEMKRSRLRRTFRMAGSLNSKQHSRFYAQSS